MMMTQVQYTNLYAFYFILNKKTEKTKKRKKGREQKGENSEVA
jgi:hypothetical protein